MRQIIIGLVFVFLNACKENEVIPTAAFDYTFTNPDAATYLKSFPTHQSLKITNASTDAISYRWDFGDGTTSTEKEPVFDYEKSGEYTIRLTTTSRTGDQQTSTKSIKIVDRVLKRIHFSFLNWEALQDLPDWPISKIADVQVVIGRRENSDPPTAPSTIFYESSRVKDVNTITPPTIPVDQKIVIDPPFSGSSRALVVNVYGYDNGGKKLLFSSAVSGAGFSAYPDRRTGFYVLRTGVGGTIVELQCAYE